MAKGRGLKKIKKERGAIKKRHFDNHNSFVNWAAVENEFVDAKFANLIL
jgi:hypothetical protein